MAQISERNQIFLLFESLAFPLIILLGFFTAGRLAVLATVLLHSAAAYLLGRPQFMKEEYLETRFPRPESKSEVDGDGEAAPES